MDLMRIARVAAALKDIAPEIQASFTEMVQVINDINERTKRIEALLQQHGKSGHD